MARFITYPSNDKLSKIVPPVWEERNVTCSGCDAIFTVERGDVIQPTQIKDTEGFFTFCLGCGHPIFVPVRQVSKIVKAGIQ